jgi:hypothetical protein
MAGDGLSRRRALQPAQLADLEAWIARQDAQLSRPEAIHRLLEQALAVSQPRKLSTWLPRSWTRPNRLQKKRALRRAVDYGADPL